MSPADVSPKVVAGGVTGTVMLIITALLTLVHVDMPAPLVAAIVTAGSSAAAWWRTDPLRGGS